MPTYEYHCDACGQDLEVFQSMKDDPLDSCPLCATKGQIHRKISGGAGIIFKGSGFYETDYKRPAAPKSGSESTGSSTEPKSAGKDTGSSPSTSGNTPAKAATATASS